MLRCIETSRSPPSHGEIRVGGSGASARIEREQILMIGLVSERLDQLRELCGTHGVARLDLFGSAASGAFDPNRSDLDFVVEFKTLRDVSIADQYFGLHEDLEQLFQRRIDLVMNRALRNRFLIRSIEATREPLYASEVA